MNVTKPNVTLPNATKSHELRDEDIRKYIGLYFKQEVENGRDPLSLSLKHTIEVFLKLKFQQTDFQKRWHLKLTMVHSLGLNSCVSFISAHQLVYTN